MSVETTEYAEMMRRMLVGWQRRLADGDLVDVEELVAFTDEVDEALARVVDSLRERGVSWQEVGDAMGTTRQAAQQRFGVSEHALRRPA